MSLLPFPLLDTCPHRTHISSYRIYLLFKCRDNFLPCFEKIPAYPPCLLGTTLRFLKEGYLDRPLGYIFVSVWSSSWRHILFSEPTPLRIFFSYVSTRGYVLNRRAGRKRRSQTSLALHATFFSTQQIVFRVIAARKFAYRLTF
jgi:hypothetical protein